MKYQNAFLVHYGILGQKWGVRRFQNEDRSLTPEGRIRYGHNVNPKSLDKDMKKGVRSKQLTQAHTIPKGTRIYRTTSTAEDRDKGTTYVSYMDVDRQHYKGGWIRNSGKTGEAYEHEYVLNEDLHVPSREESRKAISEVMRENEKTIRNTVKAYLDASMPEGGWERIERMYADVNKPDPSEKDLQKAWNKFIDEEIGRFKNLTVDEAAFYTMQSLGLNPTVREKVIRKLKANGYNAMTDEASVGGQNGWLKEGGDPLIVFDQSNLFTKVSSHQIGEREERKSDKKYQKQIRKAWQNRSGSWSAL